MSKFFYSVDHLWFEVENKTVKIGITDHLKSRITPIFIQISNVGTILKSGAAAGVLESNKSAYELTIPFTCKITERNENLLLSPTSISQLEETSNWLCIAEICDEKWNIDLMDKEEYQSYIAP